MTIPIVRKRAKRPKCRTGCITCRARHTKCDETRPSCLRCSKAGRVCEGYSAAALSKSTSRPLLPRLDGANAGSSLPLQISAGSLPCLTQSDGQDFEFFSRVTIHHLPGTSWDVSWERIALQMSCQEPVVRFAITALGALHRAVLQDETLSKSAIDVDRELSHRALALYGKAVASLRSILSNVDIGCQESQSESIVLCALLFACFEAFSGRDEQVSLHLRTTFRIVHNHLPSAKIGGGKHVIHLHYPPRNTMDVLTQTLVRLDADLTMVGEDEPFFSPVCDDRMPSWFQSLDEANVHLDALTTRVQNTLDNLRTVARRDLAPSWLARPPDDNEEYLLSVAASRMVDLRLEPDLVDAMVMVERDFQLWSSAFSFLKITPENGEEYSLTQIYFSYLRILVQTWRDTTEMAVDRFEGEFDRMISLIEDYLKSYRTRINSGTKTPAAFSFGTGLIPCVYLLAIKARPSSIRKRCVQVLLEMNLRGVFDNFYLASFLQAVINFEEHRSRDICGYLESRELQCHDMPEQARLLAVSMYPMLHEDRVDFYKENTGTLLYVTHSHEGGNGMQVGRMEFAVARPQRIATTA